MIVRMLCACEFSPPVVSSLRPFATTIAYEPEPCASHSQACLTPISLSECHSICSQDTGLQRLAAKYLWQHHGDQVISPERSLRLCMLIKESQFNI